MSRHRWQPPHPDPAKTRTREAPPPVPPVKPWYVCIWTDCDKAHAPQLRVPLCFDHANKVATDVTRYTTAEAQRQRAEAEATIDAGLRLTGGPVPGWVYYIEIDGLIKIGYTTNIINRTRAYPPTAKLLAIEPGTKALERGRHSIFGQHLARGREWFNDHPDIRTWIDTLRAEYGDPSDEAYTFSAPTEKKPIVGGKRMNRRW